MRAIHTAESVSGRFLEDLLEIRNEGFVKAQSHGHRYTTHPLLLVGLGVCAVIAVAQTVFCGTLFSLCKGASFIVDVNWCAEPFYRMARSSSFTIGRSLVAVFQVWRYYEVCSLEAVARLNLSQIHPLIFGWCFDEKDREILQLIERMERLNDEFRSINIRLGTIVQGFQQLGGRVQSLNFSRILQTLLPNINTAASPAA
jgi:hypothetical protein